MKFFSIAVLVLAFGVTASAVAEETDRMGFSHPLPGLGAETAKTFALGRALFRKVRLSGDRSDGHGGLGPVFNRNACSGCHERNGRGRPPSPPESVMTTMVVHFSGGEPAYGEQLNDKAIIGVPAEGQATLVPAQPVHVEMEGRDVSLQALRVVLQEMAFGPVSSKAAISPRVAPMVAGAGLLEAIPAEAILARADPTDADADGISGRARMVTGPEGTEILGRFGWRARLSSVREQVANALWEDMGVTNRYRPLPNCTPVQRKCLAHAQATGPEMSAADLTALVVYVRLLAPPERRNADTSEIKKGETMFRRIGCAACHVPEWTFVPSPLSEGGEVTVRAWTDLLLHDMGEGLADRRTDGSLGPAEWRTTPLWGIGMVRTINGHTRFLHDGRARNLTEAILWHGGEASTAREAFLGLAPNTRQALLTFLNSL